MEDNIDINNVINENVKRKIVRNKRKVYANERKLLVDNIINILGNHFLSDVFDDNIDKLNQILLLKPEIKRLFSTSLWSAFNHSDVIKNPALSIVKSVMKDMHDYVDLSCKTYKVIKNNRSTCVTEYFIRLK